MYIEIIKAENFEDLNICAQLRKKVFGDEEKSPESLYIIDEYDLKPDTCNYLLKLQNVPIATVRFIKQDINTIKIQRLVVLKEYRQNGYAAILIKNLEKDAYLIGYRKIILDSSKNAVGFYEKYGYEVISDLFYEDNRPHFTMHKILCQKN